MNTSENQFLITPDLSEAVESTGIPAGTYSARVSGLEVKKTKDLTGQYIRWEMTVFGAEGALKNWNGWRINYNTMTSGKGAGMLKSFFKACTGQELTGAYDFQLLVGSEVQVTVVEGKNQDGTPSKYPEVKSVKPITH